MFDTINHRPVIREAVPYEKNIVITENRAPTDESVKLLNEMQDKAISNVVHSVSVTDNSINAVVFYFIREAATWSYEWRARFTFNGKETTLSGIINRGDLLRENKYGSNQAAVAIYISICEQIAKNILQSAEVFELINKLHY